MINKKLILLYLLNICTVAKGMHVQLLNPPNLTYQTQEELNINQQRIHRRLLNRIRQISYSLFAISLILIYSAFFFDRPSPFDNNLSQDRTILTHPRKNVLALGIMCAGFTLLFALTAFLLK